MLPWETSWGKSSGEEDILFGHSEEFPKNNPLVLRPWLETWRHPPHP